MSELIVEVDERTSDVGPDAWPAISVVVIGRNEGERLHRCLASVRGADYPSDRLELIYVDSDSTDGSCAAAEAHSAKLIRLKTEQAGAAAARNAGIHAASHEIIQFLDGDTELHPDWLKRGVDALRTSGESGVFGHVRELHPEASIYNFWGDHDWYFPPGRAEACGGVAMFRRDMLRRSGGFDPALIAGEERDLCHRIVHRHGGTLLCLDFPMAAHDLDMHSFRQYWRRCLRSGHAYAEVGSRYSDLHAWRSTCRRNLAHAVVAVTAVVVSVGWMSPWPILIWLILVLGLITRNACRLKRRVDGFGRAWVYAAHHYTSKLPTILGHVDFYLRRTWNGQRRRLIEHREDHSVARRFHADQR